MENKSLKRILAGILAAIMAMSLAGCGNRDDISKSEKPETSVDALSSQVESEQYQDSETIEAPQTELPETETEVETEAPKGSDLGLTEQQLNSFSMLYYLAITAEEIRTSKDNRLMLEDIYTSLLNDINPGAIDEITQDHLQNLRDIIGSYIDISVKRDRIQFLYNQAKASAIRDAVPNPLAVLSMSSSVNWKRFCNQCSIFHC